MPDPYWEKVAEDAKKAREARDLERLRTLGPQPPIPKKDGEKRSRMKHVWICLSCKQETKEHWIVLNRRSRPKCPGCGSIRYEPKTAAAKDDMAANRSVRKIVDGPPGTGNGTFIVS